MTGKEQIKTKSLFRRKKLAVIIVSALIVLFAVALVIANTLVKTKKVTLEDTTYLAKPNENGIYALYTEDGVPLKTTEDGYYILNSGSLAVLDRENGEAEVYIRIDISGTEQLSTDGRVLIFPHLSREDIRSITVNNQNGGYKFKTEKDENGASVFVIDGYEEAIYNGERFAMLIAVAGYTKATRIDKEISLDKFGYEEYGLDKESASYTIETVGGEAYTVWIGDKTTDGSGYYVRMKNDDRYALYILNTVSYIEETLLASVENMAKTVFNISYFGQNMSTAYIDVQDCKLTHYSYENGEASGEVYSHFSYLSKMPDGTNRLDGEYKSQPFIGLGDTAMYTPNANSVNEMLYNLNTLTPIRTVHLGTGKSALEKYGLLQPAVSLEYKHTNDDGTVDRQRLYFSKKTENDTYYAYSVISRDGERLYEYNQIVEFDAGSLDFLSYSKSRWVESGYFFLYADFCDSIEVVRGDEKYLIELDHATETDVVSIVKNGERIVFSNENKSYYDKRGNAQIAKKSVSLFNSFYIMLETSAIIGEHGLTDAEKAQYMISGNLNMSIKIITTSGRELSYEFYRVSDVRSILKLSTKNAPYTVGNPASSDFYTLTNRADKIWQDLASLFEGARLFANGKYEEYSNIVISSK